VLVAKAVVRQGMSSLWVSARVDVGSSRGQCQGQAGMRSLVTQESCEGPRPATGADRPETLPLPAGRSQGRGVRLSCQLGTSTSIASPASACLLCLHLLCS